MAAFAVVPGQRASWRSLQRRQLARGFLPWTSPNPEKGTKISSEGRHEGGNATEAIGPVSASVLVASPTFGVGEVDKHTSYRTNHIKSLSSQLSLYSRIDWSAKKM